MVFLGSDPAVDGRLQEPGPGLYCMLSMAAHPSLFCALGCALAALLTVGLGALLRGCGLRRAWIVSGVLVGIMLGPVALAQVREAWFDRLFHGAAMERREVFVTERVIEVARLTAVPQGAEVDADDMAMFLAEREAARDRLRQTRERFDELAVWTAAVLAAVACVTVSPLAGRTAWWRDGGAPIGAWALAAPAALALVALSMTRQPDPSAWWLDLLAMVCVGSPVMLPRERWIAARLVGGRVAGIDASRAVAGLLAIGLVVVARLAQGDGPAAWLLPWGALFVTWGLAAPPSGWPVRLAGPAAGMAVAMALTRMDPLAQWMPWLALAIFVAASDLKWIGTATGLAIWGRVGWMRALRASMPLEDAGTAMAALAALATLAGVVPAWAGLSVMVSAAAVELLDPVRRGTALQLDATIQGQRADGA